MSKFSESEPPPNSESGAESNFESSNVRASHDDVDAEQDKVLEQDKSPDTGVAKGIHPDLLEVKRRVSVRSMWVLIAVMAASIAVISGGAFLAGGSIQFWKAISAAGLAMAGVILGYLVLLRPVDSLNLIGMVYFSILLRMGVGLSGVLIMRQIDTPLYGKDWVGYLLAFYGIGLFSETILAARSIKSD